MTQVAPSLGKPKSRRKKVFIPPSDKFKPCVFSCPGCCKELPARKWVNPKNSKQTRVEVNSPTGKNLGMSMKWQLHLHFFCLNFFFINSLRLGTHEYLWRYVPTMFDLYCSRWRAWKGLPQCWPHTSDATHSLTAPSPSTLQTETRYRNAPSRSWILANSRQAVGLPPPPCRSSKARWSSSLCAISMSSNRLSTPSKLYYHGIIYCL